MQQLTKDFFTHNRKQLAISIGKKGLVVVSGNGLMQRSADTSYKFRQDSNLYYLTGIQEPCMTLIIDTNTNQEWLMLSIRTGIHAIFDGEVNIKKLAEQSGIDDIVDEQEGYRRLKKLHAMVWHSPARPKPRLGDMFTNPYRAQVLSKITRIMDKKPQDIRLHLSKLRAIKYPQELVLISQAIDITHASLESVLKNIDNYSSEQDIEAELTKQFIMRGASGHAYQPIIAGGAVSCVLHYTDNSAVLKKGNVLLFDIGAEVANYAADISRTIVYGSKPSTLQADVMQAVLQAQQEIIAWLRPGKTFKELAQIADSIVAKKLIDLNLIPTNYQQSDLRKYFPHAVSHFLGLDVHDAGDYSVPLEPGMVITVEPGIYIADKSIGVRIEDDVVITKNGAQVLGKSPLTLL